MSDALVRLVGPSDLPVRIPDWPENVGIAVCRVAGRTVALQPYNTGEAGPKLRRRLIEEVGETLQGFAAYPATKSIPEAKIGYSEDQKILAELENALRSMPRLIEAVQDFAINFEFAEEEGLGLDGLSDSARRKSESSSEPTRSATEPLPVGYHPFLKPDPNCEVISGATLKPVGAAGVDLVLVAEKGLPSRDIPPEASVLVREDSLRVAIPLAQVLIDGRLPPVMRLPAGSLLLGATNGKPIPAVVLRRGGYLFVSPDYSSVSNPAAVAQGEKSKSKFPWVAVMIAILAIVVVAAIAVGTLYLMPSGSGAAQSTAPVDNLRSNMFAPSAPAAGQ